MAEAAAPVAAPAAGEPPAPGGRALDRGFWLLFCSSALCFLSIGAYAPVLPRFVQDALGGGGLEVGLVTGITAVVAIVLRPSAGALGDRRGRRFAALLGALVMGGGAALLLGPEALPLVLLARLAIGLGEALLSIASMAWVIDRAPTAHRGRALGAFGMSIWLGLGLGPLAAEALRVHHGFTAVWIFCTATALASGLLLVFLPEARDVPVAQRPQLHAHRLRGLLPQIPTAALRPGAVIALALYGEGIMGAFGVIHLVDRGVPEGRSSAARRRSSPSSPPSPSRRGSAPWCWSTASARSAARCWRTRSSAAAGRCSRSRRGSRRRRPARRWSAPATRCSTRRSGCS